MDIESLTDFINLAKHKSFSKAAAARHVTQPAFSRRIRALEINLTTDLIDRQSRNFQLTPAGERFLVHALSIVDAAQRAISDTQSMVTRLHQPIYISAPSYLSKTFFPAWYKKMQAALPGLAIRLTNRNGSAAVDDLQKGLADFALVMIVEGVPVCYADDTLQKYRVGSDSVIAVRARHAIDDTGLLMHEGSYMNACADAVLGKKFKNAHTVFESSSTGLLKEMTLAGFGISVLPTSLVEDDLSQGYLTPVEGTKKAKADIFLVRVAKLGGKKAEKLWSLNRP